MPSDQTIEVLTVKARFGRSRIVARIGTMVLSHFLLFDAPHTERARAQAKRIEAILRRAADPLARLDATLWDDGSRAPMKCRVFRPKSG